jgi:hypothetical protein
VVGNTVSGSETVGIQVYSSGNTIGKIGYGNVVVDCSGDCIDIYGGNNTVSGNTCKDSYQGAGITLEYLQGADNFCTNNTVQGNTITDNYAGGINLGNGATGNLIGGYSSGQGNVIAEPWSGVGTESGNTIVGNSISVYEGYYGISGFPSQDAPVITSASDLFSLATITGTVHSAPHSTVRIELFASEAESTISAVPPVGNEGQTYLGYVNVTTNAFGNATFSDVEGGTVGKMITATATEGGTTSQFSNAVTETQRFIFPSKLKFHV